MKGIQLTLNAKVDPVQKRAIKHILGDCFVFCLNMFHLILI
jgi:hypothetical protein